MKTLIKVYTIYAIIILLGMTIISTYGTEVKTITIPELPPYTFFPLNLEKGDKVLGSFSVQGGYKIAFGVAEGNIYSGKWILTMESKSEASFEFTAKEDGAYFLYFNSGGYHEPITVTVSYDIIKPGSTGTLTPPNPLFIVLITIIIVLVISLGFLVYKVRKSKSKAELTTSMS